jgi:hypothetical protein
MMSDRPSLQPAPQWRAASRCNNGECVEVALLPSGKVGVRDNKNPDGPVLEFSVGAWEDFLRKMHGSH